MFTRLQLNKTKTDNVLMAGMTTDDFHDVMEQVFLDWTNNYLSIDKFAAAYGITAEQAKVVISIGRTGNIWK